MKAAERLALKSLRGRPVNRRRLLQGIGVLGGAVVGSAAGLFYSLSKLAPKEKHKITLAFTGNFFAQDAKHLEDLIVAAKKRGEPFHAIAVETIGQKESEVKNALAEHANILTRLRERFEQLRKSGVPEGEALDRALKPMEEGQTHLFIPALTRIAVKHNLHIIPMEWYEENAAEGLLEIDSQIGELLQKTRKINSLEKQMPFQEEAQRLIARYNEIRNHAISNQVGSVVKIASTIAAVPDKTPVRVIYALRRDHAYFSREIKHPDIEVETSLFPRTALSPVDKVRRILAENVKAKIEETDLAKIVVAENLSAVEHYLIKAGKTKLLDNLRRKIEDYSLKQFKELDEKTRGMHEVERAIKIYEILTDEKLPLEEIRPAPFPIFPIPQTRFAFRENRTKTRA